MEEAKKMICYKRLIFKQFVQVSGLFGPQFLSYLPKRFTHLCRALYGDAINMAAGNQQKHLEFTFSICNRAARAVQRRQRPEAKEQWHNDMNPLDARSGLK